MLVIKSIFDWIFAIFGLIVLSPILLVIALAIMVQMRCINPFYTQSRIGQYGKPFKIYKFRTMYDADEHCNKRESSIGLLLHKYKLNELPQLVNIILGDMSFVGPRPDVSGYADKLQGKDRLILELKPGITGPASIKYKNEDKILASVDNPKQYNNEVIYPDKVRINLEYYYNHTFISDLKLIFLTLFNRNL
ncbi:MAG: sugar transferase [Muribaculaceae bacterium]|nr:sugar transferase [Muribaculaceae bacterium]